MNKHNNVGLAFAMVAAVAVESMYDSWRWLFSSSAEAFDLNRFQNFPSISEVRGRERRDEEGRTYFAVSDAPDAPSWHDVRDELHRECWKDATEAFRQVFGEKPLSREEWVTVLQPEGEIRQSDVPVMECVGIFPGWRRLNGSVWAEDIRGLSDYDLVHQFRAAVRSAHHRAPLPNYITRSLAEVIISRPSFREDSIKSWARGAAEEAEAYLAS